MRNVVCVLIFGMVLSVAVASVSAETHPAQPMMLKDPALSGVLSVIMPGAGQVYNNQYLKAAGFFLDNALGIVLAVGSMEEDSDDVIKEGKGAQFGIGVALILSAYGVGAYDAVVSSKKINARMMRSSALRLEATPSGYGVMASYRF